MTLLQGSKKDFVTVAPVAAAAAKELEKPASDAQAPPAETDVELVEIDDMDDTALDALVAKHDVPVPGDWKAMALVDKKAWLTEKLGEDQGETPAPTAMPAPTLVAAAEPEDKKAKKTTGKKPKKGTAMVASGLQVGEVLEPGVDVIGDVASEIENLKEEDARLLVPRLQEDFEFGYFKLGGVLSVIQSNSWFAPHASFKEYVENERGIHLRRATYWIELYTKMVDSKVPWSAVKHLGWTKLSRIVGMLTSDNYEQWVKIAEQQTTLQFEETVRKAKEAAKRSLTNPEDGEAKTVTTKTFKVHEDQKATIEAALKKAKEVSTTTVDTAALEFICLDFLGGNAKATAPLHEQLKQLGIEKAVEAFNEAFPDTQLALDASDTAAAA